jgi:hypothetical protein
MGSTYYGEMSVESFIVRIWVPGDGEDALDRSIHGQVVRLASGATRNFRDPEGLVAFIREELATPLLLPEAERPQQVDEAPA